MGVPIVAGFGEVNFSLFPMAFLLLSLLPSVSIWPSIKRMYLLLMEVVFLSDYQGGTRKEFSKLC